MTSAVLQASLFGAQDGQGLSLVFYFSLPEGWEPHHVANVAALELLQRFIHDGRESDKYASLCVQYLHAPRCHSSCTVLPQHPLLVLYQLVLLVSGSGQQPCIVWTCNACLWSVGALLGA